MKRLTHPTAAALIVLALVACQQDTPDSSTPEASPNTEAADLQFGSVDEDSGEMIVREQSAVWNAQTEAAATSVAIDALIAYARPALDSATWLRELAPYLDDRARRDYAYFTPAALTVTTVDPASAVATPDEAALFASITIQTDAGPYEVIVSRRDSLNPWRVAQFRSLGERP